MASKLKLTDVNFIAWRTYTTIFGGIQKKTRLFGRPSNRDGLYLKAEGTPLPGNPHLGKNESTLTVITLAAVRVSTERHDHRQHAWKGILLPTVSRLALHSDSLTMSGPSSIRHTICDNLPGALLVTRKRFRGFGVAGC